MPTLQNVLGFIFEITILAAMITISYILKPKLTATIGLLAITILFVAAATRLQHGLATQIRNLIQGNRMCSAELAGQTPANGTGCTNKFVACNYQLL